MPPRNYAAPMSSGSAAPRFSLSKSFWSETETYIGKRLPPESRQGIFQATVKFVGNRWHHLHADSIDDTRRALVEVVASITTILMDEPKPARGAWHANHLILNSIDYDALGGRGDRDWLSPYKPVLANVRLAARKALEELDPETQSYDWSELWDMWVRDVRAAADAHISGRGEVARLVEIIRRLEEKLPSQIRRSFMSTTKEARRQAVRRAITSSSA